MRTKILDLIALFGLFIFSACASSGTGGGTQVVKGSCAIAALEASKCALGQAPDVSRCEYWNMLNVSCAFVTAESERSLIASGPRGSGYSAQARGRNTGYYVFNNVNAAEERIAINWSAVPSDNVPEFTPAWFDAMENTFGKCTFKLCPATASTPEKIFKRFALNVPSNERAWQVKLGLQAKCLAGLFGTVQHSADCTPTLFEIWSAQATNDIDIWKTPPTGVDTPGPGPIDPPACKPCEVCEPCKVCPEPVPPVLIPSNVIAELTVSCNRIPSTRPQWRRNCLRNVGILRALGDGE